MFPVKVKELGTILEQENFSDRVISGASIDSRNTKPGDLFFALPGARLDGHAFLREAALKGAVAAIVSNNYIGEDAGLDLFRVGDVLFVLQDLARRFLSVDRPTVVAITGSLGKTTTKDFTAALLRKKFQVDCSEGNANGQLGLPLTLLNRKRKAEVIVLEMGMTERGQIAKLVQIAPPDIAAITTVALVHACNFENLEDIARAKAEIFSHPQTRLGIYNSAMPHAEVAKNAGCCKKLSFSYPFGEADYSLGMSEEEAIIFHLSKPVMKTSWQLAGLHNLQNYLTAVSIAHQMGLSWEEIKAGTAHLVLPSMRLQSIEKKGVVFINDAYNASENSVKAALASLPCPAPGRRRIAVLGEMRELGRFSEECHKNVGQFALNHVDSLFCLGELCNPMASCWKHVNRPADLFLDRDELVSALRNEAEAGDVVLLKGSRVCELWKVIEEF